MSASASPDGTGARKAPACYYVVRPKSTNADQSQQPKSIPSLRDLCMSVCAREFDKIRDLHNISVDMFVELIRHAGKNVTPDLLAAIEDTNPYLMCEEVDRTFWRGQVESHILQRKGHSAPFPLVAEELARHKRVLERICTGGEDGESSAAELQHAAEALKALERFPMTLALLKHCMVGKTVARLRKCGPKQLAEPAEALVQRWRAIASDHADPSKLEGEALKRYRQQEQLELASACQTWRQLWDLLQHQLEEKSQGFGQRVKAMKAEENKNKKRVLACASTSGTLKKAKVGTLAKGGSAGSGSSTNKLDVIRQEMRQRKAMSGPAGGPVRPVSKPFFIKKRG